MNKILNCPKCEGTGLFFIFKHFPFKLREWLIHNFNYFVCKECKGAGFIENRRYKRKKRILKDRRN